MKQKSKIKRFTARTARALFQLFPENHMLSVSEYQIESAKIPKSFDGFRICHLSDLHSHRFGKDNVRLLRRVADSKPDLVVLTGDMVSRTDSDYSVFLSFAQVLAKQYPVFYVIGNHEQTMGRAALKAFLNRLRKLGIRVLNNEKTELCRGGESLPVYGMWYPLKYYKEARHIGKHERFRLRDMHRAMGGVDPDRFCILLTHNPLSFPVYARWGADLTLCGHVHGGMIRLPFVGGLLSPERRFFPQYSEGVYTMEEKKMVVSRGLGSGVFGPRIHNVPEVVNLTLRSVPGGGNNRFEKGVFKREG
ncbi:metallophosphoesterase [Caproiciproducens sp. LBM24188]|nr:metallophosphoesterase [Clostridiales bacterium]